MKQAFEDFDRNKTGQVSQLIIREILSYLSKNLLRLKKNIF